MQIEEKQIVINGQNITLRSPGKQDAETFQRCVTSPTVKRISGEIPGGDRFHSGRSRGDDFRHSRAQGRIFDRSVSERADDWLCHGFKRGKSHQIPA